MSELVLKMPSNYVDIEREEMGYINGGHKDIIAVWLAGALINTAITAATGVGVSGIRAFIARYGAAQAKRIFTATVVSRLTAWGAGGLASTVSTAVDVALGAADMGSSIAHYIDAHDAYRNNGWITI